MTVGSPSPVGDVDTIDVVGVRKDGGLDLVISVAAPLDASPSTLSLLEAKIRNYIKAAQSEAFLARYGRSLGVPVTIYVSCTHPIAEAARAVIEKLTDSALEDGISLEVQAHMGEVH
jgi:uncharacterized protein DUF6572